ncbi:hypothetical protein EYF80_010144 [Liparis tanakae]|uniref:Uncharacterized protein n=1 Tax=Liparis tanakae TaxID=230148 RepID=A0A4Z2IQR0_9TELE|nr:hypothetical protein EYF80_010144 [Liparis tanakae]
MSLLCRSAEPDEMALGAPPSDNMATDKARLICFGVWILRWTRDIKGARLTRDENQTQSVLHTRDNGDALTDASASRASPDPRAADTGRQGGQPSLNQGGASMQAPPDPEIRCK